MEIDLPGKKIVSLGSLDELVDRTSNILNELRRRMLLPEAVKIAPVITSDKLAELCNITKGQLYYRAKTGMPEGKVSGRGGRMEFSIDEVHTWTRSERKARMRPEGQQAVVVAVAFFKGGVTKTTTTMCLAQGLSLLGHRVLNIDLDPQGSLTTLHGILPDSEIGADETLVDLFAGRQTDVRYAIRKTYWPGIDLIPASSPLFHSEFDLPTRQVLSPGFEFWDVLNKGLASVRDDYDVILIDTPPSLSYATVNALYAANGVISPMTASMLDLASAAQFWKMYVEISTSIEFAHLKPEDEVIYTDDNKSFDFVNILLSKVNSSDAATRAVRDWISTVFGGKLMPTEIPLTAVTSTSAIEFSTVFDITKYDGDSRTYKRAREAYEAAVLAIEEDIVATWARRAS